MRVILALTAALAVTAAASATDFYSNYGGLGSPSAIGLSSGATTLSGVAAPAGFEWSECQNEIPTESNTSAGSSFHPSGTLGNFRLADDFTVMPGETFDLDQICLYGYQTGSAAGTNPFAGINLRIWDGRPGDPGSSVIFGDTTTNRLAAMNNTNLYRIFNTVAPPPGSAPGTTRLIRELVVDADITLGAGTYWLDWQAALATGTTVFAPAITIPGVRGLPGWNARQLVLPTGATEASWTDVLDTGNPAAAPDVPLDFPFILKGTYVPEPASLLLLGLAGVLLRRR